MTDYLVLLTYPLIGTHLYARGSDPETVFNWYLKGMENVGTNGTCTLAKVLLEDSKPLLEELKEAMEWEQENES